MENTLNTLIKNGPTQKAFNNAQNVILLLQGLYYLTPILKYTKKAFQAFSRLKSILFVGTFFGSNWGLVVQQNMHEIVNYALSFFFRT
jgi:hypothetical protein